MFLAQSVDLNERARVLYEQCSQYNAMIDAIDTQMVTLVVTCLGFIGVVLGLVFSIVNRSKDNQDRWQHDSKIASLLLLLAPSTMSMLVYVLAMFSRRVATYRGYAAACEQGWNDLSGHAQLVFNDEVVREFYKLNGNKLTESFFTNTFGPYFMGLLVLALLVGSFYASWLLFHGNGQGAPLGSSLYQQIDRIYLPAFSLLALICVGVSLCAVADFLSNAAVTASVRDYALGLMH